MRKKIISIILGLTLLLSLATPLVAAAASESDIIKNIKQGVTVNGQHKDISASYIKMVQDYLANNELTNAQIKSVIAALEDARSTWVATGKLNFNDMTKEEQEALIGKAIAAAKAIGAKLTYNGKTVKVVDPEGGTYTTNLAGDAIKQTGSDYTPFVIIALALLVVFGTAFAVARRKRLFSTTSA
jgi:hypothetical protein